jgi:hypothetical protein
MSHNRRLRRGGAAAVATFAFAAALPTAGVAHAGSSQAPPAGSTVHAAARTVLAPMGPSAAATTAHARAGRPRGTPPATTRSTAVATGSFWELQLNLCNSGFAGCYANGDAVFEGGDLIYYLAPDLVTLNEICSNDLPNYLQPSLAEAWPGDWTYSVFVPAVDRRTNGAYKCRNGDDFGNAILGRIPAGSYQGVSGWGGTYTTQDSGNEQRTFACAYAIGDHFACTTHLSAAAEPIALAQCRALMFDAVPYIKAVEGSSGRTVVGGDFNLEYDPADSENAQNCVPAGHTRKGDGDVQHVIFSNDVAFESTSRYGLTYTDHDGFLVRLVMP